MSSVRKDHHLVQTKYLLPKARTKGKAKDVTHDHNHIIVGSRGRSLVPHTRMDPRPVRGGGGSDAILMVIHTHISDSLLISFFA